MISSYERKDVGRQGIIKASQIVLMEPWLLMGQQHSPVINDAYHTISTKDLLHFSHCPSFDAATDNTLMICGLPIHTWRDTVSSSENRQKPFLSTKNTL